MIKKAKIHDIEVEYEVIHRKVKNARLEIKTDKIRLDYAIKSVMKTKKLFKNIPIGYITRLHA